VSESRVTVVDLSTVLIARRKLPGTAARSDFGRLLAVGQGFQSRLNARRLGRRQRPPKRLPNRPPLTTVRKIATLSGGALGSWFDELIGLIPVGMSV